MQTPKNSDPLILLKRDLEELSNEVKKLSESTKALVDAWNTATGVVKFVKLLSTFIAAIGVVWFFVTNGFTKAP